MKIEDAIAALRTGKKIRHLAMKEDEFYMACHISIGSNILKPTSIVWMKGKKQHPDMNPIFHPFDPDKDPCKHVDPDKDLCKHGMFPMMNLLWLMSEAWEILND